MSSRGERNNNPGNLEASPWTKSQPGYKGTDGRFAQFDTMANGIAAQVKLLTNRYLSKGYDTPNKIIWRYGNDPGTADDKSVRNYIAYVARRLGINIDDQIDPSQAGALAQAMREFETGNTRKGAIGGGGIGGIAEGALGTMRDIEKKALDGIGLDGEWWTDPNASITELDPTGISGFLKSFFTGEMAARFSAVIIGFLLIGVALVAFIMVGGNPAKVVKDQLGKVTA